MQWLSSCAILRWYVVRQRVAPIDRIGRAVGGKFWFHYPKHGLLATIETLKWSMKHARKNLLVMTFSPNWMRSGSTSSSMLWHRIILPDKYLYMLVLTSQVASASIGVVEQDLRYIRSIQEGVSMKYQWSETWILCSSRNELVENPPQRASRLADGWRGKQATTTQPLQSSHGSAAASTTTSTNF